MTRRTQGQTAFMFSCQIQSTWEKPLNGTPQFPCNRIPIRGLHCSLPPHHSPQMHFPAGESASACLGARDTLGGRLGWGWPAGMGLAGRTLTPRLCSEDNDWQMPSSFSNPRHTLNGWTPDSGSHSYSLSSQRAGPLSSEPGRYLPGKAELTGLLP